MLKSLFILPAFVLIFSVCTQSQSPDPIHVLVFSKTSGFRHASISSGIKMLYDLSKEEQWVLTATEDAAMFTDEILAGYDVAVFLNPTQDVLDEAQQGSFERFIGSGKGFVGIHASADCEYDWAWYGKLNGAYFKTHPPAQEATVIIEDTSHPAMKPFEGMETFTILDEWYTFKENPRPNVHVLARLDESTVTKAKDDSWKMGDHPLIWWQEFGSARSFYTVFGHPHESFQNEVVVDHIRLAINWAARRID
jgi:type 1 glutamine amidotransferase